MKQLRILTGLHAGARLRLLARSYRIAADDDADLQISDWQHEPITLQLEEGQATMLLLAQAGSDAEACELADFVPRRFGDIALCVGPEGGAWPSDLDLLSQIVKPAAATTGAVHRGEAEPGAGRPADGSTRGSALIAGAIAATALLAGFTTIVVRASTTAPPRTTVIANLQERVKQAVASSKVPGISVQQIGSQVAIEGLLPDNASVVRLRATLQPFASEPLVHRYASASDVARSITEALGNPGLTASYRGHGVFVVGGSSLALDKVRDATQRVASDLAPLVQHIEIDATELPPPERIPVGAMLNASGLQYVQTRDGVKHLVLNNEPTEPVEIIEGPEPVSSLPPPSDHQEHSHGPSTREQRVR